MGGATDTAVKAEHSGGRLQNTFTANAVDWQQENTKSYAGSKLLSRAHSPVNKQMKQSEERDQDHDAPNRVDARYERLVFPVEHRVQHFFFPPFVVPDKIEENVQHSERLCDDDVPQLELVRN